MFTYKTHSDVAKQTKVNIKAFFGENWIRCYLLFWCL